MRWLEGRAVLQCDHLVRLEGDLARITGVLLSVDPGLDLMAVVGLVAQQLGRTDRLAPDREELTERADPPGLWRFDVDSPGAMV